MATTIAEMTTDEFRDLIEAVIEQKLVELLGDPDAGLSLRKALQDRPGSLNRGINGTI